MIDFEDLFEEFCVILDRIKNCKFLKTYNSLKDNACWQLEYIKSPVGHEELIGFFTQVRKLTYDSEDCHLLKMCRSYTEWSGDDWGKYYEREVTTILSNVKHLFTFRCEDSGVETNNIFDDYSKFFFNGLFMHSSLKKKKKWELMFCGHDCSLGEAFMVRAFMMYYFKVIDLSFYFKAVVKKNNLTL